MKGFIAINTKHTGNRRKDNRGYAETMTSEQVDSLLSEPWLKEMVAEIRGGNEKKKDNLPYICPHYERFRNNHRSQADIIPEAFTYMTCVDVDDKQLVGKAIQRAVAVNRDKYSDWQDHVLRMEYSARKKLHIYIRIPKGKTIEEAQRAFCKEIDIPYDESCITPERFIYLTGIDEEIYRSPLWLEQLSEAELAERREAYLERGLDVDGRRLKEGAKVEAEAKAEVEAEAKAEGCPSSEPSFKGMTYSSIITRWWERNGGVPQEGERNVKLYQLAVNLRAICDNNKSLLLRIMPRLGLSEQELQSIVDSACKETPKGISKTMREILEPSCTGDSAEAVATPPRMPSRLPRLIQLLTSNTPDLYKEAVAHAVFPSLATHLCGVRFCYTDNVEHEATLMNCLMAGTGSGKGCINEPIKHIMADIRSRDRENELREAEWKKVCQKKGANKDKRVRPEGLVIQIIDPDMTKPALVTRMDEAEGHFVYVKLNELDLFEQLKGQTGKQHFQLMCLAFDPGAEYGQTRVGTQSVTARPECRFNWNACSTVLKGRRFFRNVLTDGPISRINFCTIPEEEIGAEQPLYGKYDAAFDEELKPYIDNLVSAKGLIDCPQAFMLAKKLQEEVAEFSRLSQNDVYWNLSHRACVIAWLKACVLYVANGQKWEKSIDDFIRWSLDYDLWCKMQFFGADIEKASRVDDSRIGTRGPRNLLEMLPDVFTLEDAKRVRQQQGMGTEKTAAMIRNWKNRGYVVQYSEFSFQKKSYK